MAILDPSEQPTPREILISLNAHVATCSLLQRINMGFMAAVLSVLVLFAGYTYNQNQMMQRETLDAVVKASAQADQTRAVAQMVGAPITH